MSAFDFNTAEVSGSGSSGPIPDGTVAPVILHLRGLKTSSRDTRIQGLDLEYTVLEGPFKGRKAWKWAGITGTGSDGHNKMIAITRSMIRGILESAYGVRSTDDSPEAMAARKINDWDDLDGIAFVARFGIEEGSDYVDARSGDTVKGKAKNTVTAVGVDEADYAGFKPAKPKAAGIPKPPAGVKASTRPAWG
jgi:hypothetical protein